MLAKDRPRRLSARICAAGRSGPGRRCASRLPTRQGRQQAALLIQAQRLDADRSGRRFRRD